MRARLETFSATAVLLFTAAALTLALALSPSGLTAVSVSPMDGENNMWNFEKGWF